MGNVLEYGYIIPKEWNEHYSKEDLIAYISDCLTEREENSAYNGTVVDVDGVSATLNIMHERMYWWFALPGDVQPNPRRYYFSEKLLPIMFPDVEAKYELNPDLEPEELDEKPIGDKVNAGDKSCGSEDSPNR